MCVCVCVCVYIYDLHTFVCYICMHMHVCDSNHHASRRDCTVVAPKLDVCVCVCVCVCVFVCMHHVFEC